MKSNSTYHIFFTKLANPLKINILLSLRDEEKNVGELTKELKVEQSKISHALASLRNCRIVNVKQEGKQKVYSLNKETIIPMLDLIDKHSKNFCDCKCCTNTLKGINKKCGKIK